MFRLFLAQLGFLPISVLLVTIIVNQLLNRHAKRSKLAKLNMVIGAFFSDAGTELLKMIAKYDLNLAKLRGEIISINRWSDSDFLSFDKRLINYDPKMEVSESDLETLRGFLWGKRDFLMRLLENPNILEHDSFSNLLLTVFHLAEDLAHRTQVARLTLADKEHLVGDLTRSYVFLTTEWVAYMRHLKNNYPYLFSLALRTNPFDPEATPEFK